MNEAGGETPRWSLFNCPQEQKAIIDIRSLKSHDFEQKEQKQVMILKVCFRQKFFVALELKLGGLKLGNTVGRYLMRFGD